MKRVLMTALAAAATVAFAAPAMAAPTVIATNGTPLANQIYGDTTVNDQIHVFGTAPSNGGAINVEYTGDTALHITNGFAQIQDAGTQGDLHDIIINPTDLFTQMKFSTQLEGTSGTVVVYYLLAGSGLDPNAISSYTNTAACLIGGVQYCGVAGQYTSGQNDNQNYLLAGGTFDGMMVQTLDSSFSLFQLKQNSYNGAGPSVPEPASWALMLLGFGGIGLAMRRRKPALAQLA
jgi:hypothetical protein